MAGVARSANDAAAFVTTYAAAGEDPVLSAAEVTTIVAEFKTLDADGNAPTSDDWTPTYDLYAAVASAWRVKAGKAAGRYTFQTGAARENESDLHAHCMKMAAEFDRYNVGAAPIAGQVGRHMQEDAEVINIGHPWES